MAYFNWFGKGRERRVDGVSEGSVKEIRVREKAVPRALKGQENGSKMLEGIREGPCKLQNPSLK